MLKPYNRAQIDFEVISEIGAEGRNSQTFVIMDHQLGAEIVAKRIPKADLQSEDEFFEESKLLYASAHPNVVQIHYACFDDDYIYLAMPYYRRGSVKTLLGQRFLTVREVVSLGCQALAGLHNIHSKGLIHFDLKPDNILLSDRGEALVSDFGLAKQINHRGVAEQDRFYVKTLPPEGLRGYEHDVTFDIYQFGLTLYRMCNGDEAFQVQFANFLNGAGDLDRGRFRVALRNGQFPSRTQFPAHVPRRLRTVTKACLEPDSANRPQSAIEVANELATIDSALDWLHDVDHDTRVWTKNENGTSYELRVAADDSSTMYKAINGGQRRRVGAACRDRVTERDITTLLGSY